MANSSVISNRNDWFFDPFQGMGSGYTGAGGGGGGGAVAGQTSAYASLAGLGAALATAIINYKGKYKDVHLPGEKGKTDTTQTEAKKEELTPGIPSDLIQIGKQELPYLPNAGLLGQAEAKKDKVITPGIPSDLIQIGKQELPYLPNAGLLGQAEGEKTTFPTIPPISEGLPEIKDETSTNIESEISPGFDMQSMYDFIIQQQQRQWDREDAIRAETQAREDNAYQRAVEDMRKAGINPNLVGVNPAQSGGGITQATGLDYSPWTAEINKQLALMEQEIQNSFQGDENAKDRFTKSLTSLLQLFTMLAMK